MSIHRLRTHPIYVDECFGCKASTVVVANGQIRAVAHKNERELNAYRDARKQGLQPRSTRMEDTSKAIRVADRVGQPVRMG